MEIKWTDGFSIKVVIDNDTVILNANREGLLSLSDLLASMANQLPGTDIHLDEYNSLEDGSAELVIVRTK